MRQRWSIVVVLALVASLLGGVAQAAGTPRRNLSFTSQEVLNNNFSTIDATLPFGTQQRTLRFCGQNVSSSTVYAGPAVSAFFGRTNALQGDATCDALDNGTEATADNPVNASFPAFKVLGMYCSVSSDPTADVVLTARSAAADLSPTLTCTVAGTGSGQDCWAYFTGAAPTIAPGAAVAVKSVTGEDLSAQDFSCDWIIQFN